MKKEGLQNPQQGMSSAENKIYQKNQTTNISNTQQNNVTGRAGLGRERMTDEEFESDEDDLNNEYLNASNDQ